MSRYKAYAEYKDSGVESLTKIPTHWEHTRVKYIGELTPKKPVIDRKLECSFIPMEKLKTDSITLDETRVVGDVYDGYTYFQDEDILMAKVTPCFENKNIAVAKNLVNGIGFGSSEIYVIRTKKDVCNRYWFYRFQEDSFMDIATAAMSGAGGLKRVPSDVVTNFTAALPSILEQQTIANFLDHETAKIDTLIAKQQGLIKLLKEKRQAVISHAVTKGLNPNAPMRDSGVEWLGEVPAHWDVWKFGQFSPIITCGIAATPEYVDEENGVPFLSAQNIQNNQLSLHKFSYITKELHAQLTKYRQPEKGDVLVTRVGAGIGAACVIDIDMVFSIYVSLTHIRVNPSIAFNKFIVYFFACDYCQYLNYQGTVTGGGVGNLNVQNVIRYQVPLPNLDEQIKIVEYLDSEGEKFSALIEKAEIAISLMQERRTALISAAVTGKIDVRDWQPASVPELEDATA
ncbi:restriction endonuclease subunit S [Undibacterium sp.]|uniref:restriction endonuclease subunit S n=1 Tax=Undibacterium sp. TaxID=1914977 RepID=UPI0025E6008E|nr:restriction endonuclease subunit S [Undibacterium sp.]